MHGKRTNSENGPDRKKNSGRSKGNEGGGSEEDKLRLKTRRNLGEIRKLVHSAEGENARARGKRWVWGGGGD